MNPVNERGMAIIKRLPKGAQVAEVGVLIGRLSEFILNHRSDVHLTMVDSWAPRDQQPDHYKETGDTHAFHDQERVDLHKKQALRRVAPYVNRYRVIHNTSLEAAALVPDASLDMVFLDADHSYKGVCEDIQAWVMKVKPGGYIGGHDYLNDSAGFRFGVTEAVDEMFSMVDIEVDLNFTWFVRV